jgi:hypothetical protein
MSAEKQSSSKSSIKKGNYILKALHYLRLKTSQSINANAIGIR